MKLRCRSLCSVGILVGMLFNCPAKRLEIFGETLCAHGETAQRLLEL